MTKTPADWKGLELADGAATLILGWRPRRKRLDASRIEIDGDVASTLREIARETLNRFEDLQAKPYEDTASLAEGEEYFDLAISAVPRLPSGDQPSPAPNPSPETEEEDAEQEAAEVADLLRLLEDPGAREQILPGQAGEGTFLFYALICEDSEGKQVSFVKQQPRFRVARTGRLLTMFGDRLRKIENPVFSFSGDFDLVIHDNEMAILRAEAYVQLFTDVDVLRDAVPGFVRQVNDRVAVSLTTATQERLEKQCKERPSLAKRLRKLSRKSWLSSITPGSLRAQLADLPELGPGITVAADGEVDTTEAAVPTLLRLFEDVYYRGHHDATLRAAQTYTFGVRGT